MLERYERKILAAGGADDFTDIVNEKVKPDDKFRLYRKGTEAEDYRRQWTHKIINGAKVLTDPNKRILVLPAANNSEDQNATDQRTLMIRIML